MTLHHVYGVLKMTGRMHRESKYMLLDQNLAALAPSVASTLRWLDQGTEPISCSQAI